MHEEEFVGVGFDLAHQFNELDEDEELPPDEPFTHVPVPPIGST